MGHTQTAHQHPSDESLGLHSGKGGVKGQLVKLTDPKFFKTMGAGFGIHQPESRGSGGEVLAGMRLERHDTQGGIIVAGQIDHRLMTQMHAVEIAHRHRGAPVAWQKSGPVRMRPHRPPTIRRPYGGSTRRDHFNLRLGANTSASPFRTTVSPTEQWVSRVTRRLERLMPRTFTSA